MMKMLCELLIVSGVLLGGAAFGENIEFPADAGIADVQRDYGAKGDGVTDDTAAIQKALNEKRNLIYFRNGVYLVSDTLRWGDRQTRQIFQGQSEAGTIIKLPDHAKGFQQPDRPQAVIWTGQAPAQRFRNGIRNLTVDTGSKNPGAIGVQYMANNQGAMRHVTIRSGDGAGVIGLDLGYSNEQGPCLIHDVHVLGFDIGVFNKHAVDSVAMEDITVENQNRYGSVNEGQIVTIRGFVSHNRVPAFFNRAGASLLTLVDARCDGGAPGTAAIINEAGLFARHVESAGYDAAIQNSGGHRESPEGNTVAEFTSHPVASLFPSPPQSLNLPVKPFPEIAWHDAKDWVSVNAYPPKQVKYLRADGKTVEVTDWTDAIQQAIDSGAKTVYFPGSNYQIMGTVYVRGRVERLLGLDNGWRNAAGIDKGTIVIDDGDAPVVVMEHFDTMYAALTYLHRSKRTFVMRSVCHNEWTRIQKLAGSGDLFLDDTGGGELLIDGGHVWARNLNYEGEQIKNKIRNDGGILNILGYKTEGDTLLLDNLNGAKTEITGGFIYANKDRNPAKVMFANDGTSSLSFSIGEWVIRNQPFNPVRETRDGETRTLTNKDVAHRGQGAMIPLYVGYQGTATQPPEAPTGLKAEPSGTCEIALSWAASGGDADGLLVEKSPDGKTFEQLALLSNDKTSTRVRGLKPGVRYTLRVARFNAKGRTDASPVTATTLAPAPAGTGTGLRGDYFESDDLMNPKFTRTDATVDFDFKTKPPEGLTPDNLTVRWTGEIQSCTSETYEFKTGRQGTRLWVDGKLLFDGWNKRDWTGSLDLEAGRSVPIKLEVLGGDPIALTWKSDNQASQTIPQTQLYPAANAQPEFTIKAEPDTVSEKGDPQAALTLTRTGDAATAVTIPCRIGGSATPDADYTAIRREITLPAGSASATIPVEIKDDNIPEREEAITVVLELSPDYATPGGGVGIKIADDDTPPAGSGTGLNGDYFNDTELKASIAKRLDPQLNFNWNKSAPIVGVKVQRGDRDKGFSARWTGEIQPLFSERYKFEVNMSGYAGAKVWIGDKQIIDAWDKRGLRTGEIVLEAGKKYPIRIEFSHRNFYDNRIALSWSSPSQFEQTVPKTQLYPAP